MRKLEVHEVDADILEDILHDAWSYIQKLEDCIEALSAGKQLDESQKAFIELLEIMI